ncbi:MAG: hypothetical protein AB7N91_28285 [Candidatus Tectimicrobiota bacterium]
MTAKKGDGLLMVYCEVPERYEEEFNAWYNTEHIPERLAIPGVLNAARYQAVAGGPKYLACYELASPDAWYTAAWQQWLTNPTPWSRRMSPSVIGTAYIRNLYRRIYPATVPAETAQADMAPVILVGRMSVPAELDAKFNEAYNNERLPLCDRIPGYIRARRFEAVMGEPKYTTVHEMTSLDVWKSQAWDDWRTAVTPVWNSEIRQVMTHAAGSPGVFQRIFPA